jgi:myo-inositol-1(or 4)-monophosphatase
VVSTDWRTLMIGAAEAARSAVASVRWEDRGRVVGRGASGDSTLLADRLAEEAILASLGRVRGLRVLSEESGETGPRRAALAAVVDPLDGSGNFSRGIGFYCVSIAVAEGRRLSDVTHGLVFDLVTGSHYYAQKGVGAYKDGRPIRSSRRRTLAGSVVGLDLSGVPEAGAESFAKLIGSAGRIVHLGANALEISLLAAGALDCFADMRGKMRVTDVAAALLIASEAGAAVGDSQGEPLDAPLDIKERVDVVASGNSVLQRRLLKAAPHRIH